MSEQEQDQEDPYVTEDPFLSVRAASAESGVPVRSVYNAIDRKAVRTRTAADSKQTLLVHREDVERIASTRAAGMNAGTLPGPDGQTAGGGTGRTPVSAALLAARERVELRKLEALEQRAAEDVRRAEAEALLADGEREHRRQAAALAVERERLALDRDVARVAEERAAAVERARREDLEHRAAAAERERRNLAEAERERAAARRGTWEARLIGEIDRHIIEDLGRPDLVPRARATVRSVLRDLGPTDADSLVWKVLNAALGRDLAAAYAERDDEARDTLAREVADQVAARCRAEVVVAVHEAARAAAAQECVPADAPARARITHAATNAREKALDVVHLREQRAEMEAATRLVAVLASLRG